ncbi:MAG TPA: hypothetical protein VHZ54_08895 [Solirubrobacterales bacterium]|jgi:hypothetical protein|nr:hypothetical protein [Solirubrobacterales bacterium]
MAELEQVADAECCSSAARTICREPTEAYGLDMTDEAGSAIVRVRRPL